MVSFLRSSKLQKQLQIFEEWTSAKNTPPTKKNFSYQTTIHVPESIWDDIPIREWGNTFLCIPSELDFLEEVVKHPTVDTMLLEKRQQVLHQFQSVPSQNTILNHEREAILQWFQHSPQFSKNYLYNVLFPSSWYIRWVKLNSWVFELYHYYRCYFSPLSSLMYPISAFLAPYWFLTKKWKLKISFLQYLKTLQGILRIIKNQSEKPFYWYKFVAILIAYISIYLYSIFQMIDLSIQLHKFRRNLLQRIKQLYVIQQELKKKIKHCPPEFWKIYEPSIETTDIFFTFKPNLWNLYKILQTPSLQEKIEKLHKVCTIYNTLLKTSIHLRQGYHLPNYGQETFIGDMKNPMLPKEQVANPIWFKKNIILSGPNAGGKTTYVKSFLWNLLLSQSIGIVYGSYSQIKVYDAFLHHHRIRDITGDSSLFQAEMKKIRETLECTNHYKNIVYFMDEPLHSTHPVDGAAMLKSLLLYISNHSNIQVIITSHYFFIQSLEKESNMFTNICVKAKVNHPEIYFDYKIYKGPSKQTIGIELLEKEDFPKTILRDATKYKNILYSQRINV